MNKEELKVAFENAREAYAKCLYAETKALIEKVESSIEILHNAKKFEDIQAIADDFHIEICKDNTYSDYFNYVTFISMSPDGVLQLGSGVWDSTYDYSDFSTSDIPDDIDALLSMISELTYQVNWFEKEIPNILGA